MLNYLEQLAKEYNMSKENVLSIALNRYGLVIPNYPDNRIRFNLNMNGHNTFFAVCVNTYLESPFTLKDNMIYLEDAPIGVVSNIENVEIEGEKVEYASVDMPVIKYIFK